MKFTKRICGLALAMLLSAQMCLVSFAQTDVSAADNNEKESNNLVTASTSSEDTDSDKELPASQNDPSYWKNRIAVVSRDSASGSESLTHQSRFDSYTKSYGIDVSYYQGNINWAKAKADGVEYAIIRAGYRGYGNGALVQDSNLYTYLNGAKAAGIKVGLYFYTQAINTTEAKAEATFVMNLISGYKLDMPIYYDIEAVDYDTGRLDSAGLSKTQKTALCSSFCDAIKAGGYTSGVYTNYSWFKYSVDGEGLGKKYPIWLAHYTNSTDYPYDYQMWQYACKGSVDGISGYVDMNVLYTDSHSPSGTPVLSSDSNGVISTLSWTKTSNTKGYRLYKQDSAGKSTLVTDTTSASKLVELSNTAYSYYVIPYNVYNGTTYTGNKSNVITLQKNKAENLRCSSKSANKIVLNWDSLASATGYRIYCKLPGASSFSRVGEVTGTSFTMSGLSAGSNYSYKIKSFTNYDGTTKYDASKSTFGIASDIITVKTNPGKASGLKAQSATASSISLSWSSLTGCSGYEVLSYNKSSNTYKSIGATTGTTYTVAGLSASTEYSYVVRGYMTENNAKVYGSYSSAVTYATKPAQVSGLKLVKFGNGRIYLQWNSTSNVDYYEIYKVVGTSYTKIGQTGITSYTVSGCKLNTTYKYAVRAVKCRGYGNFISAVSNTLTVNYSMPAPTNFIPTTAYTSNTVTLQWNGVTGATGYRIYAYNPNKKSYYIYSDVNSNTLTVKNLAANKGYTFKVKALFSDTKGVASAAMTAYTKPVTPTGFRATSKTSSSVSLSWGKVSNATYYRIYKYNTSTKQYEKYKDVYGTSVKLTGLKSKTSYKFAVAAVNITSVRHYLSSKSGAVSVTTS